MRGKLDENVLKNHLNNLSAAHIPPPAGVRVQALSETTAVITWSPVQDAEGYEVNLMRLLLIVM